MKIAVYFSGHLRTAEYAAENLLNYIGDLFPNIDIFVHTWKENKYKRLHDGSKLFQEMLAEKNITSDVNKIDLKYFFPHTPPDTFEILVKLNKMYNNKIVLAEVEHGNFHVGFITKFKGIPSRFYSWYKANELRKQYESTYNSKYDIIVKLRPDAIFSLDSNLKNDIEHCLNHSERDTTLFCCSDIVFVSVPSVMDIASDFVINNEPIDFSNYISPLGIKIKSTVTTKWSVYRPESIPMSSMNFDYCENHNRGWYCPVVRGYMKS